MIDLLDKNNDQLVVMSGGDELRLRFKVPEKPVPDGWRRDFILHSYGWDKDANLNTLTGQTVGPLPFPEQQSYPPTIDQIEASAAYEQAHSARMNRRQNFRAFWAKP